MTQEIDKFFPARSENENPFLRDIYLTNEYKNQRERKRMFSFLLCSTFSFSLGFVGGYLAALKLNPK